jgi:SAM-dependent methyltransferase
MKKAEARHYVGSAQDFDRIGDWQYKWLIKNIKKTDRFLDFGCGSMRLGKHLIPWLNSGRYIGIDFRQDVIDAGLENEFENIAVLTEKKPQFICNSVFDLSSIQNKIDVIWVYAVFIHLNDTNVKLALKNCLDALSDDGVIYCTFHQKAVGPKPNEDFVYSGRTQSTYMRPVSAIKELFNDAGLTLKHVDSTPKNQWLFKCQRT